MRRSTVEVIGVSMALAAAACGGGDDGASSSAAVTVTVAAGVADVAAERYVDALAAYWMASPNPHPASEVRCIAAGTVEVVGVDALDSAGVTPEIIREEGLDIGPIEVEPRVSVTREQDDALHDVLRACTEGRQLERVWSTELDAAGTSEDKISMSSRIAADDEQSYVGLSDGVLHVLDSSDGTERWTFDATGGTDPARFEDWMNALNRFELYPTVAGESVYLGTNTGIVYALDRATGTLRWSYDAATVTGSPVVIGEVVVIGDWSGVMIDNTGGWATYIGRGPARGDDPERPGAPAVVKALDMSTGTQRWSSQMPYLNAIAAADDDVLVVASATGPSNIDRDSVVARLDPATGATVWSVDEGGTIRPAVGAGDVYIVEDTTMIAVAADSGQQRWAADVSGTQYSGADGAGGWPEQVIATTEAVVAVIGGDPWWVVGVEPASGRSLWEREGDSEGGFDIAAVGDDLTVTQTNFPFFVADPATGTSMAYVDTDTLLTGAGVMTPRFAVRSSGLWVGVDAAWVVGLR